MSEARVTTDRKQIQNWVEERDGYPARVAGTDGRSGGLIRIDYEGYSGEGSLERITWEEWFDAFEKNNLAFLYQDQVKGGGKSRFSKLIDRDSQEAGGR
jgi:hypothetical protein